MTKREKADFGFDAEMEARLEKGADSGDSAKAGSTMGALIRDTADKSRRRFAEAPDMERKKLLFAAKMAELERRDLDLRIVDLDSIITDGFKRDRIEPTEDGLEELCCSIRASGLETPIRLIETSDGRLLLNQGLRRVLAFKRLFGETGEEQFASIPALVAPDGDRDAIYRRMVDENMVREQVSFGELAVLAIGYAEETGCEIDQSVSRLFASAQKMKRSYIRAAVKVMDRLRDGVAHPERITRRTFLALARRIDEDGFVERVRAELIAKSDRSPDEEEQLLSRVSKGLAPTSVGTDEGAASSPRKLRLHVGDGGVTVDVAISARRVTVKGADFDDLSDERIAEAVSALLGSPARTAG